MKPDYIKHQQPDDWVPDTLKYWIEQDGNDYIMCGSDGQEEHVMHRHKYKGRVLLELEEQKEMHKDYNDPILAEDADSFTIKFPKRYFD